MKEGGIHSRGREKREDWKKKNTYDTVATKVRQILYQLFLHVLRAETTGEDTLPDVLYVSSYAHNNGRTKGTLT